MALESRLDTVPPVRRNTAFSLALPFPSDRTPCGVAALPPSFLTDPDGMENSRIRVGREGRLEWGAVKFQGRSRAGGAVWMRGPHAASTRE